MSGLSWESVFKPSTVIQLHLCSFRRKLCPCLLDREPTVLQIAPMYRSVSELSPIAFPPSTTILFDTPPTIHYCSCSSCCGCFYVAIPTDVTAIADNAFKRCGGGYELAGLIIPTWDALFFENLLFKNNNHIENLLFEDLRIYLLAVNNNVSGMVES